MDDDESDVVLQWSENDDEDFGDDNNVDDDERDDVLEWSENDDAGNDDDARVE